MVHRKLLHLLLAVIPICLTPPAAFPARADDRPNILFAFADDWGRNASIYAKIDGPGTVNDAVSTPHFDQIARDGVLFQNAFVTAPSCTPCRSSLLSGQYFFRTGQGAILQGAKWDPTIPSYPLLLRDAGYHIGETYKVWSPGSPADAPYGAGDYSYAQAGHRFNQFSQRVTSMVAEGRPLQEAKQELYDEVDQNFARFLQDRKADQPFCYWFGPTLVHRKWVKGSGKDLWGIEPDSLIGKMPRFLPDVPEVRQDFADYLGEIQAFDAALGLLLKRLDEIGELDRTLIVVSGDHGAPGFPRGKCNLYDFGVRVPLAVRWGKAPAGRVVDDFVNLMDLAPTFLEAARSPVPEVMTGRSIVPVLTSNQSGRVDPSRSWVVTGRERHVAGARAGRLPYPQRAIRTSEYLYIINFKPDRWPMGDPLSVTEQAAPSYDELMNNTFVAFGDFDASPTKAWLIDHRNDPLFKQHYHWAFAKRPYEELYVLANDPDQIHNVAEDSSYTAVKKRLHDMLIKELKQAQDPRVLGDGDTFDQPPYAGKE